MRTGMRCCIFTKLRQNYPWALGIFGAGGSGDGSDFSFEFFVADGIDGDDYFLSQGADSQSGFPCGWLLIHFCVSGRM